MDSINYKGTEYPVREFKVKELGYIITVAPYSLFEVNPLDDDGDVFIDGLVTYYVDDEHFGKPALELCESYLDEPFTLINEIL
jgi:hypothetical protein